MFSKPRNTKLEKAMEGYYFLIDNSADELMAVLKGTHAGTFMPAIGRLLLDEWDETAESKALAKKLKAKLSSQNHSGGSYMCTLQQFLHKI